MELSDALKAWAVEHLDVAADASEDEFKSAIADAIKLGTLTAGKYAELMAEDPEVKQELATMLATANAPVIEGLGKVANAVGDLATKLTPQDPPPVKDPPPAEGLDADAVNAAIDERVTKMLADKGESEPDRASILMAKAAIAGQSNPRVKAVRERYSTERKAAICPTSIGRGKAHPYAGEQAKIYGKSLHHPSDYDLAVCGAFAKWQLLRGTVGPGACEARLNEHERGLILSALHEDDWNGVAGVPAGQETRIDLLGTEINDRKLTDMERKAIIDDTTSGGSYAVPRAFDEAIAAAPILFGELAPLVDTQNLARGSVVDGTTWTDPNFGAQTEGSAFDLVSTASLIGNLDTSIFATVAGIELGLDWESDTPINFGTYIVQRLGMKLKEWLDNQIANGDGTTEPTGIFTASGLNSASSGNGTGGPFLIGDFEKLAFGVTKAMRNSNPRSCVYVTSDYMYRQGRSTAIGTADVRGVFGLDHSSYTLLEHPCKIQDSIANGSIAFANLSYYRLFRRLGIQIRNVIEGQTLALKNTRLIIVRARYGGQPTLGASICKMTDGPTSYGN